MSFSWRPLLVIFLVALLLSGCAAINKLMQEDFTGPSWDVDLVLPLVPTQQIMIGESFAEQFDVTEGGGFQVEDTIDGLETIYPMREVDLADFTTAIEKTINMDEDEDGESRFDFDNLLDIEEARYDLEEYKDQLNYESFDFSEIYDDFAVSEDTLDKVRDSFEEKEADVEVPEIPDSIMQELGDKFAIDPPRSINPDGLGGFDSDPDLEGTIEFDEFEEFVEVTFAQGGLGISIENKLGTTVDEVTVALFNQGEEEPLTQVSYNEGIDDGDNVELFLDLADVTMKNKAQLQITADLQGDPAGGSPSLDIGVVPQEPEVYKAVVSDPYEIDEEITLDPFYDEDMGVKKVEFQGGDLVIHLEIDPELATVLTVYELDVVIGEGEEDEVAFVEGNNSLDGILLNLEREPKVYFQAVDLTTYVANAEIKVIISLEVEQEDLYRVTMADPIDFDGVREVDRPEDMEIREILFQEGSYLIIDIVYGNEEGEEEIDYSISIDIGGKVFDEEPIDLSSQGILTFHREGCMVINFETELYTYLAGSQITVDVYLHEDAEVVEAWMEEESPFTIDGDIEEPLAGFPEDVSRIIFAEGILEVDIDDDGLGIDVTDMHINLGGQDLERIEDTTQFSLAGVDLEAPADGWEELDVLVTFEAEAVYYNAHKEITLNVDLLDMHLERVYLVEQVEEIRESITELLGEERGGAIREITFSSGLLEIFIDDGDLELEYSLDIFFGEDRLDPVSDSDNAYLYNLEEYVMVFPEEEELEMLVLFSLESLSYQQDQDNIVEVDGELYDMDWLEMKVLLDDPSAMGVPAEFTPFEEDFVIELGLHDFPDIFKQIRINRDLFHFDLIFTNETPFSFETKGFQDEEGEGDLIMAAIGGDQELIERFKIRIPGALPGEQVRYSLAEEDETFNDRILDLFETFPEKIEIQGGIFSLLGSDAVVTINKDQSVDVEGEYSLGLSLVLERDPGLDSFVIRLEPEPLDFDMDEQEMFQWIQDATLHYEIVNSIPFDGYVSLYLGQFYGDYEDEDDVTSFYEDEDHYRLDILNLPPPTLDADGFVVEASEIYRGDTSFTRTVLDWFMEEDLHYGLQVTIPFEEEDQKTLTFSIADYLQLKMWVSAGVRINP